MTDDKATDNVTLKPPNPFSTAKTAAPTGGLSSAPGLRPSLLSAKADAIWAKSKLNFEASGGGIAMGAVKLKTKTFSDLVTKTAEQLEQEKEEKDKAPKKTFIFGQNIASRVIQNGVPMAEAKEDTNNVPKKAEELFREVAASHGGDSGIVAKSYEEFKKEAAEAAVKQKEQHEKQIPTTSLIDVKTGEEDDFVVFQTACKLHVFDKPQKRYVEKGMATIKINKRFDEEGEHHRIVARTTGIHRLVINSQIFPDMLLERVDQKRLKISAMGPEHPTIQVFLVTIGFTNSDLSIEGLYHTLTSLIEKSKEETKSRKRKNSESGEEVEAKKPAEEEKTENARQQLEASKPFKTGGFEEYASKPVNPQQQEEDLKNECSEEEAAELSGSSKDE